MILKETCCNQNRINTRIILAVCEAAKATEQSSKRKQRMRQEEIK